VRICVLSSLSMYITKWILLCTVCWYGELYHVS